MNTVINKTTEKNDLFSHHHNGRAVLVDILNKSEFGSLEQAVASLVLFSHPETVRQLSCKNAFRIIRMKSIDSRGKYDSQQMVMFDDNKGPTDAFIWANGITRGKYVDVQFNHIWDVSSDLESYTNLANICLSPAFLSKLTDTDPKIRNLLRYRSLDLYNGWHPKGKETPAKPKGYDTLKWGPPLPAVANLENIYRDEMKKKPRDRTTVSARELGWHFSNNQPDDKI